MKKMNFRKYKLFPYATANKNAMQQWNYLLKLTLKQKRMFKNKTRLFSMEYGRSLPKRIFWQVSIPLFQGNKDKPYQKKLKENLLKNLPNSKNILNKHPSFLKLQTFQHSWSVFRSVFFGKMWMLNNPSLVPGVVWPVKSKKILVAKMRAFKALSHLTGKGNLKFVVKNMQKLWNSSLSTKPSLWNLASGVDSLKASYLLKSGMIPTLHNGLHLLSYSKVLMNGHCTNKNLNFFYPGDFIQLNMSNYSKQLNVFANLLNTGPRKDSLKISKKYGNSIYSGKVFSWLSSFYNNKKNNVFLYSPNHTKFFPVKKNTFFTKKKYPRNL